MLLFSTSAEFYHCQSPEVFLAQSIQALTPSCIRRRVEHSSKIIPREKFIKKSMQLHLTKTVQVVGAMSNLRQNYMLLYAMNTIRDDYH